MDQGAMNTLQSSEIKLNNLSSVVEHDQDTEENSLIGINTEGTQRHEDTYSSNEVKQNRYKRVKERFTHFFAPKNLCPVSTWPLKLFSCLLFLSLLWGSSYTLLEDNIAPHSSLFMLLVLFILAYIAGQCILPLKLPPLLGMLIVGIAVRNLNFFHMIGPYGTLVTTLRSMAMIVILIKAGLGLDAAALQKLSLLVIRLAFVPCLIEAGVVTCISHLILGLPWLWGLLLGFILGAVSPAVVVPSLLNLKEKGYGEDKGISTLVIAASSIDDIAAISGFGVTLGIIFSEGNLVQQILQGPLEVVIGLSFGLAWGVVCIYIPHKDDTWVVAERVFMVGGGAIFALFGSQMVDFSGAGPLACIVIAFVSCCGWKAQGWSSTYNPVEKCFSTIWKFFQPVLFGLIGTEINLLALEGHTVGLGIAVLCCGLVIRIIVSFLVVCGGTLNYKEMFFIAISWFPKATVQAALGPVALDYVQKYGGDEVVKGYASQVLTIAVLAILLTAPLGAIGIFLAGPYLLNQVPEKTVQTPVGADTTSEDKGNIV